MKRCVLHADKVCNDCGECDDRCELDPQKICDNCFRCLEADTRAFAEIPISGVFFGDDFSPEREDGVPVDFEEGYVLDSDESWKGDGLLRIRTLPMTYGARVRRTHKKR
ncbi:MAG: hypothetical protein GX417_06835 [Clostridiales bacterium]|nr:hypothetical protein [Clostridiales bacterium]